MPSTTAPDLVERVAGEEKAGVCGGKVCAEFEDDLPYVGKPLGEGVDGLGEELFPAGAFLEEGASGVAGELEEEGGDLCLFCLEAEGRHAGEPAVDVCCGCGGGPARVVRGAVEEGGEVAADETLLGIGGEGVVEGEEPGQGGQQHGGWEGHCTFCSLVFPWGKVKSRLEALP